MNSTVTVNKPYDISVMIPVLNLSPRSLKVSGKFTHRRSGTTLKIRGFLNRKNQVILRYSLPFEGEWEYVVRGSWSDRSLDKGTLRCKITSETRYPVEVTSGKVRPIFTQNNQPYFMSMFECNWLFALWMSDEQNARRYLATIKKHRFNSIAMNIYAHGCAWTKEGTPGRLVPPPLFNWGGTNDNPDFSTINPDFYERFDQLMNCMYELDLVAHLYLFVWNKGNNYPETGSYEESEYVSYVIRRYQAYPNVIWDYCKEAYLRIDKKHIRHMVKLMRSEDIYKRLLTVHDDKLIQYDDSFDDLLDFYTMQLKHDYYSKTLREIEKGKKPVFTAEYTYESGKDLNDKTFEDAHSFKDYMLSSWELAIAGSPICYYYTYSAWDVIRVDDNPQGYAGSEFLVKYFESFDWWNFTAVPEENRLVRTQQACAKHIDKTEFLLLTDKCGRFGIVVDFEKYHMVGEWVDIYTGDRKDIQSSDFTHEYNSEITFAMCPFAERHGSKGYCLARFELKENTLTT